MMTKKGERSGVDYIGTFNNEARADVYVIKGCAAELINHINHYGKDKRRNAIACTHVEEAAMMAVKSIFALEEANDDQ